MENQKAPNTEKIFIQDAGISFWPDFFQLSASWAGFFMVVVVGAGLKGSFNTGYFIFGSLVAAILATLLAFRGLWSSITSFRFRSSEIELSSTTFNAFKRGKHIVIPYEKCSVIETEYWRFRRIHMLHLERLGHFECTLTDVSFEKSYGDIRRELEQRLPKEQVILLVSPPNG